MRKQSFIVLAGLVAGLVFQSPNVHAMGHVDLDPEFVSEVGTIFNVENDHTPFDLSLISDENPNLHLYREANIYITFIHEAANYKNQFGYFTYADTNEDGVISEDEISNQELIFADVSEEDGTLHEGDTVKIGPFAAGTQIGFFIVADGYVDPKGIFTTLDELNDDGKPHMVMVATSDGGNVAIGIEDKPWEQSDLDFNDVIFTFTTDPANALTEIIEDSNIPVNDTPGDINDGHPKSCEKVCFCHNINHHPHTICTSEQALINAHMGHVNGEVPGVQDSLGECEAEESPVPSEEPIDQPTEQPTEQPVDQPTTDTDGDQPQAITTIGFEPKTDVSNSDVVGSAEVSAAQQWGSLEGSGSAGAASGCSLSSLGATNSDLPVWTLFGFALLLTPLRRMKR